MQNIKRILPWVLSAFIAFVFIQSLFFKFTGSPETQHIFGVLDQWAATRFGLEGLFVGGIFDAKVIGGAELVASLLLLAGLFLQRPIFSAAGALLALGIISGAIAFHLFTPLGIEVQNDGGTLFYMACGVFVSSFIIVILQRKALCPFSCAEKESGKER